MFSWMHWTIPSGIGFLGMFVLITSLAVLDKYRPGFPRKGFLPLETTRGDRVFISIVCLFIVFLLWLKFISDVSIYGAVAISAALVFTIMKWG